MTAEPKPEASTSTLQRFKSFDDARKWYDASGLTCPVTVIVESDTGIGTGTRLTMFAKVRRRPRRHFPQD
jgi:hypothetical protein